jgi:hypothetical protein
MGMGSSVRTCSPCGLGLGAVPGRLGGVLELLHVHPGHAGGAVIGVQRSPRCDEIDRRHIHLVDVVLPASVAELRPVVVATGVVQRVECGRLRVGAGAGLRAITSLIAASSGLGVPIVGDVGCLLAVAAEVAGTELGCPVRILGVVGDPLPRVGQCGARGMDRVARRIGRDEAYAGVFDPELAFRVVTEPVQSLGADRVHLEREAGPARERMLLPVAGRLRLVEAPFPSGRAALELECVCAAGEEVVHLRGSRASGERIAFIARHRGRSFGVAIRFG